MGFPIFLHQPRRHQERGMGDGPRDPRPMDQIVREQIKELGASSFDALSDEEQQQLAREWFCTPGVIRTVLARSAGERRRSQAAAQQRSQAPAPFADAREAVEIVRARIARQEKKKGRNMDKNKRGTRPLYAETITDLHLARRPALRAAIAELAPIIGVDPAATPRQQLACVERHVRKVRLLAEHDDSERVQDLERRANAFQRVLDRAIRDDIDRMSRLADAHGSVRRQAAARAALR